MSDAGYTLVETLTALAILALAIHGVTTGLQLMARQQRVVTEIVGDTAARRAAEAALSRELEARGPFHAHKPEQLSGDPTRFQFDCGLAALCEAVLVSAADGLKLQLSHAGELRTLPLPGAVAAQFVYHGAQGASATWPPTAAGRQVLRAVSVSPVGGSSSTSLLTSRVWREQPLACEFDPVMQDCR